MIAPKHARWLIVFLLLASVLPRTARSEEPWEETVRREIAEEDRQLEIARRRGTTRQVVARYASRLSRQPDPMLHFLLGRALYYDGDKEGAERHLREALRMEPRFWFARLRLAVLELERGNATTAQAEVVDVLRVKPMEPDALKLLSQIQMNAKDWDGAIRALESLLALDPTSEAVRRNIAFCHMAKGDWAGAIGELRVLRGRYPKDPAVRFYYAQALFHTGDLKEASRELESLARADPEDPRVLDLLRAVYVRLEDWKALEYTLERLLPLMPDGEAKQHLQEGLQRLRSGEDVAASQDPDWQPDPFALLLEQCMDPMSVETRRDALQSYYASDIPMLPSALVRRIAPELEPDPTCRMWLLRLMGKMANGALAQVAAFGLFDPDIGVRVVAAEALGEIGTPSGILYLLPYFLGMRLADPLTADQVREQNAARAALTLLTGHQDAFGSSEVWVPAEKIAAMRDDWQVWLAQDAGVRVRLRAIEDLEAQGESRPELYLIEDVLDADSRIARLAYGVLRRASGGTHEDPVAARMWPRFPQQTDEQIQDPEALQRLQSAVRAWWQAWTRERQAERERDDG